MKKPITRKDIMTGFRDTNSRGFEQKIKDFAEMAIATGKSIEEMKKVITPFIFALFDLWEDVREGVEALNGHGKKTRVLSKDETARGIVNEITLRLAEDSKK